MAAFSPGTSPPDMTTAIRFIAPSVAQGKQCFVKRAKLAQHHLGHLVAAAVFSNDHRHKGAPGQQVEQRGVRVYDAGTAAKDMSRMSSSEGLGGEFEDGLRLRDV